MIDKELKEWEQFPNLPDDVDLRSYMLGYLQGCYDSSRKYQKLFSVEFQIPLSELNDCNRYYN